MVRNVCEDSEINLVCAIMQQAACDYESVLGELLINPGNRDLQREKTKIENDIRDNDLLALADIDGEAILKKIRLKLGYNERD